jgi:hypothetical protein
MEKPTKLLLSLGLVGALAIARPAPAEAHFSLSIGLPGFGVFVQEPYPPPVFYAPPVYYPPPVAYYRPVPVFYHGYRNAYRGRGYHRGWRGHSRHWRHD